MTTIVAAKGDGGPLFVSGHADIVSSDLSSVLLASRNGDIEINQTANVGELRDARLLMAKTVDQIDGYTAAETETLIVPRTELPSGEVLGPWLCKRALGASAADRRGALEIGDWLIRRAA